MERDSPRPAGQKPLYLPRVVVSAVAPPRAIVSFSPLNETLSLFAV